MNFVTEEIAADTEVELKVDWTRRFDNMQQHSGNVLFEPRSEKTGLRGF